MKKTLIALLFCSLATVPARADHDAFHTIVEHYEPIRLALVDDGTDGIAEHAQEISQEIDRLAGEFSAQRAGVDPEAADDVLEDLPEMREAAESLASAEELDAARDAFYELTLPLVRYHARLVEKEGRPAVAYCSMAKRSWLQPEGEIGNPYHGQKMEKCGSIVSGR